MTKKSHIVSAYLIRLVSVCIGLLGLLVIYGWHFRLPRLIQIHPELAPMQYNTAVCFVITSLGLCASILEKKRLGILFGALLLLIGAVTGLQYVYHFNAGLDEALFEHYIFVDTSHPGRMSPASALMFSLSGISLVYLSIDYQKLVGTRVAGLFSSIVAILGVIALIGYIFGLAGAYGWGQLTQMALHTAFGALLSGSALMGISWLREAAITRRSPAWLPAGAITSTLFATIVFWNALKSDDRKQTLRTVEARADNIRYQITGSLDSRKRAIHRMGQRWSVSGTPDKDAWEADALITREDFPGYRAIVWINRHKMTRWLAPSISRLKSTGLPIATGKFEHQVLDDARETNSATFGRPLELLDGGKGIFLAEPITHRQWFQGYIVGVISLDPFFGEILTEDIIRGYCVKVLEGGEIIYQSKPAGETFSHEHELWNHVAFAGVDWDIKIAPTLETIRDLQSPYPKAVLLGGIVLAMLLGLSIHLTQGAFARSGEMASANEYLLLEIAERQRAEKELEEVGALQNAILSNAASAVISTDSEGIITSFNPAAEKILGYHPSEVIGKATPALFHLPAEIRSSAGKETPVSPDPPATDFSILARNASAGHSAQGEWTYRHKDGSLIPVALAVSALSGPGDQVTGYVFIASDISELKRAITLLKATHAELLETSRKAGMAEVASSVLHNVGNVLNSVNISCTVVAGKIGKLRVGSLSKASAMLESHTRDLASFVTEDPTGRKFPGFLGKLSLRMQEEQQEILSELSVLTKNIDHIKDIINMQQSHATVSGHEEMVRISEVIDHSLQITAASLAATPIEVISEIEDLPPVSLDAHQVTQILVNLLGNARYACESSPDSGKTITVRAIGKRRKIEISVSDNGIGIDPANLTRIFSHGFTTRPDGHGFGLHSSSLAAKLMGGSLVAESNGPGTGSTFTLSLPAKLEAGQPLPA